MLIKKISVANLRAYTQAEIKFLSGMNLLVGINGVGKTTILEAIRICLSHILPDITSSRSHKENFSRSDIKAGSEALHISCDFEVNNFPFNIVIHQQRKEIQEKESGNPRDQFVQTPDQEIITPSLKKNFPNYANAKQQPVAIFFSTKRSLITDQAPKKAATGQAAAFVDALSDKRVFNLQIFAQWFRAQGVLGKENPMAAKHIQVLISAVTSFLPEFSNLNVEEIDGILTFTIEKSGVVLDIRQLSDGEKGVLALVLDIAKRLSQANPELDDPLKDGKGIILIDELDLHLHPKWQRSIVEKLIKTFPHCQFIATTHSPQIIGEVKPHAVTIIEDSGTYTHQPNNSYGVDASRVLEEILDTTSRTQSVSRLLNLLYTDLDEEKLESAKIRIRNLIEILGPNDPEVIRSSTMITFLENDLADETNKEE